MKNHSQKPFSSLLLNIIPFKPWKIITANLITYLFKLEEHNAILVIVNRLIKRLHFYAITDEFSFKDLAMLLLKRYYSLHKLLLQIISNRGVQFAANFF